MKNKLIAIMLSFCLVLTMVPMTAAAGTAAANDNVMLAADENVTDPTPDVTDPTPDVTDPTPDVTDPTPDTTDPTPITKPDPKPTQPAAPTTTVTDDEPEYVATKATATVAKGVKATVKTDKKGNATLTAVKSNKKKTITIGKTVTVNGETYKVTTIGAKAFKNCKKATKVVLPDSITKVNKNAFAGAKKLKTIKFTSKKAPTVKKGAFKGLKTKKMTVQVSKKMSKKNFNKFKKSLKKAGFKGKVVRVK